MRLGLNITWYQYIVIIHKASLINELVYILEEIWILNAFVNARILDLKVLQDLWVLRINLSIHVISENLFINSIICSIQMTSSTNMNIYYFSYQYIQKHSTVFRYSKSYITCKVYNFLCSHSWDRHVNPSSHLLLLLMKASEN